MKNKSKQGRKAKKFRSYQYEISEDSVSRFGGLSLTEYLANRLGLWKNLQDQVLEMAVYSKAVAGVRALKVFPARERG